MVRIIAALRLRCPRCLKGKLFRSYTKMHDACPNCGLSFAPAPGFYIGSIYPNYATTVVIGTGLYWLLAFGLQLDHTTVFWICIGFLCLFPVWFNPYARSIWMALVYQANPNAMDRVSSEAAPQEDDEAKKEPANESNRKT